MKKLLIIGSSLNAAISEYLSSPLFKEINFLQDISFDIYSINARAFLSDANNPPFEFSTEPNISGGQIKFLNSETASDGLISWYGNSGLLNKDNSVIHLGDYDAFILNETLLWSIYPKTIEKGFYVSSIIEGGHGFEDVLQKYAPVSQAMYYFGLKINKVHSFSLLNFVRKFNENFPIFIMPLTMPRLDQKMYNELYRIARYSEIEFVRRKLSTVYNATTCDTPVSTLETPYSIRSEFTTGDIHHFNLHYVHEVFKLDIFKSWILSCVNR
jgi:hypothetical protein